ncbi:MAG TPA: hypothetical protein V6D07_12520 [Trichocoleus sp.]
MTELQDRTVSNPASANAKTVRKGWRGAISLSLLLGVAIALAFTLEFSLPFRSPKLSNTFTPDSQPAPLEIGSYDLMGRVVSAAEAQTMKATPEGQAALAPEAGALEVSQDLVDLGRDSFYRETFANEVFATDVTGMLDSPLNLLNMSRAILALGGKPTTNLQVPVNEDLTVGGQTFKAGTLLNTGLDVPKGALLPLGLTVKYDHGTLKTGITCAACHAAVDPQSGKILEGAPNLDLDAGLMLALAKNSAAWFRQTGVDPKKFPPGEGTYRDSEGNIKHLPDPQALEDVVDMAFLDWAPGNFDSTADIVENPSQIPSSYTFEAWPYGWSGFSSIGWFHGATTLNSNVHGTNSDMTAMADNSKFLLGMDKDFFLGVVLQNSDNPRFRLPEGANPTEFFESIDPTPGTPGMNELVEMPTYPQGSLFILDGLISNSPDKPFAAENNGMSAWQDTLSPPPHTDADRAVLVQGAKVFQDANCVSCHVGRYFTNHEVIGAQRIGTQPMRAPGAAKFPRIFDRPKTYPANTPVPIPADAPVLEVPTDITPDETIKLAYARNNPLGGYKVPSLIGLHVTPPYLHDGGAAATNTALEPGENGFYTVARPDEMGLAGTQVKNVPADAAASLRVLVDRDLREVAIEQNRKDITLKRSNVDGSGHKYWVDKKAGFSGEEQTALVEFLLSLDDDPAVLPEAK